MCMRDRLIHHHFGVDYEIVWDVAVSKILNLMGDSGHAGPMGWWLIPFVLSCAATQRATSRASQASTTRGQACCLFGRAMPNDAN